MAKGKKTLIKEIKLLPNDEILINGKEYIILENTKDIEKALTMKISSNGNRLLRFEDEKKKARIDVKRNIDIIKYTFESSETAKKFNKSHNKTDLTKNDKTEVIDNANSFVKAREIIDTFTTKTGENYDVNNGKTTLYMFEEIK